MPDKFCLLFPSPEVNVQS